MFLIGLFSGLVIGICIAFVVWRMLHPEPRACDVYICNLARDVPRAKQLVLELRNNNLHGVFDDAYHDKFALAKAQHTCRGVLILMNKNYVVQNGGCENEARSLFGRAQRGRPLPVLIVRTQDSVSETLITAAVASLSKLGLNRVAHNVICVSYSESQNGISELKGLLSS
jgi:hypothetical protein